MGEIEDEAPIAEKTKCKICGDLHFVDRYKGMRFYVCPRTNKIYLVAKTCSIPNANGQE